MFCAWQEYTYLKRPRLLHSLYFKTLVIVYNRSGISRHVKYAVGKVSLCKKKKKKLNQETLIQCKQKKKKGQTNLL
jgi:hypothetical protein